MIAATNKNLEEEIEKGRFREDLVFPPGRHSDPRPAAARARRGHPAARAPLHGLFQPREQRAAASASRRPRSTRSQRYRWKREHPRAAEHGRTADHHDRPATTIDVADLPRSFAAAWSGSSRPTAPKAGTREPTRRPGTLREFKENAERTFLVGKLRENNWNISKTAEVIGTPRSNLYKKLEQYQISQETDG